MPDKTHYLNLSPTDQFAQDIDFGVYEDKLLLDGDDTIYAADESDTVHGDNQVTVWAEPRLVSRGGRDTIYGQLGDNTLDGQQENDVLWGADDKLWDSDGANCSWTNDNDTLRGGEGLDQVRQQVNCDQKLNDTTQPGAAVLFWPGERRTF